MTGRVMATSDGTWGILRGFKKWNAALPDQGDSAVGGGPWMDDMFPYCWWFRNPAPPKTNPVNNRVFTISTGAGVLPPAVVSQYHDLIKKWYLVTIWLCIYMYICVCVCVYFYTPICMHHSTCIRLKNTMHFDSKTWVFALKVLLVGQLFFFFVRFKEVHVGQVPHTRGEIRWVNPLHESSQRKLVPEKTTEILPDCNAGCSFFGGAHHFLEGYHG